MSTDPHQAARPSLREAEKLQTPPADSPQNTPKMNLAITRGSLLNFRGSLSLLKLLDIVHTYPASVQRFGLRWWKVVWTVARPNTLEASNCITKFTIDSTDCDATTMSSDNSLFP